MLTLNMKASKCTPSPLKIAKTKNENGLSNFFFSRFAKISITSRTKKKNPAKSKNQPVDWTSVFSIQNELIKLIRPAVYVMNAGFAHFIE